MNRFFAPGGEFALIERMFAADHFARDGRGLGDDAYVWELPGAARPLLVTSDVSVEGVHYRLDWVSPAQALRKALAANLSDINAMGGRSRKVFFNLGARRDWSDPVYDALGAALRALEEEHGFTVSGGDTVKVAGASFFSFTVLGEVEAGEGKARPLLRSACRPGQRIYVSGTLGGSAAGLALLLRGESAGPHAEALVEAHLDPRPPLALGPLLATLGGAPSSEAGPVAAIDLSDGLSSELAHLARQSGCALRIDAARLPAHPALAARPSPFSADSIRDFLLHGGEEYQLVFTGDFSAAELARLNAVTPVTEIGSVETGAGVRIIEGGEERALEARGYSHR